MFVCAYVTCIFLAQYGSGNWLVPVAAAFDLPSAFGSGWTTGDAELLLLATAAAELPVDFWRVPLNSSLIPRENDLVLVLTEVSLIVSSVSGDVLSTW
jgi:hypothetical protein